MLYRSELELPRDVQEALPVTAQDLYRRTYNDVWLRIGGPDNRDRDQAAHAAAWRSVKQSYIKNADGEWVSSSGGTVVLDDY